MKAYKIIFVQLLFTENVLQQNVLQNKRDVKDVSDLGPDVIEFHFFVARNNTENEPCLADFNVTCVIK